MMISKRLLCGAFAATTAALLLASACNKNSTGSPTSPTTTPNLSAPTAKSPSDGAQLDTVRPTLEVNNAAATGSVGTVTYRFEVSEANDFPTGSRTSSQDNVAQGSGSTTWSPPSDLIPNTQYFWHARATNGTITTSYSTTAKFTTQNKGFINGQTVYDPLTNGETVGRQVGGHFVSGQGWQSDRLSDGIDYEIPTCTDCTVEFDITNIGKGEGACCNADLKFVSMGDGATFGSFQAFRDHPWKMHLSQRGDGDGTGLEIVWRNGGNGGGNPGDHRIKFITGGPNFLNSSVFHLVVKWTGAGYNISVGTDGGSQVPYLEDGWGGFPYAPPNHRVSLGCYPRAESFPGAIYRNVRIYHN